MNGWRDGWMDGTILDEWMEQYWMNGWNDKLRQYIPVCGVCMWLGLAIKGKSFIWLLSLWLCSLGVSSVVIACRDNIPVRLLWYIIKEGVWDNRYI